MIFCNEYGPHSIPRHIFKPEQPDAHASLRKVFRNANLEIPSCSGRIKTLLLRRKNDCFGAKFGALRQPLRPAAAAPAIDGRNKKQQIQIFFITRSSIAAID